MNSGGVTNSSHRHSTVKRTPGLHTPRKSSVVKSTRFAVSTHRGRAHSSRKSKKNSSPRKSLRGFNVSDDPISKKVAKSRSGICDLILESSALVERNAIEDGADNSYVRYDNETVLERFQRELEERTGVSKIKDGTVRLEQLRLADVQRNLTNGNINLQDAATIEQRLTHFSSKEGREIFVRACDSLGKMKKRAHTFIENHATRGKGAALNAVVSALRTSTAMQLGYYVFLPSAMIEQMKKADADIISDASPADSSIAKQESFLDGGTPMLTSLPTSLEETLARFPSAALMFHSMSDQDRDLVLEALSSYEKEIQELLVGYLERESEISELVDSFLSKEGNENDEHALQSVKLFRNELLSDLPVAGSKSKVSIGIEDSVALQLTRDELECVQAAWKKADKHVAEILGPENLDDGENTVVSETEPKYLPLTSTTSQDWKEYLADVEWDAEKEAENERASDERRKKERDDELRRNIEKEKERRRQEMENLEMEKQEAEKLKKAEQDLKLREERDEINARRQQNLEKKYGFMKKTELSIESSPSPTTESVKEEPPSIAEKKTGPQLEELIDSLFDEDPTMKSREVIPRTQSDSREPITEPTQRTYSARKMPKKTRGGVATTIPYRPHALLNPLSPRASYEQEFPWEGESQEEQGTDAPMPTDELSKDLIEKAAKRRGSIRKGRPRMRSDLSGLRRRSNSIGFGARSSSNLSQMNSSFSTSLRRSSLSQSPRHQSARRSQSPHKNSLGNNSSDSHLKPVISNADTKKKVSSSEKTVDSNKNRKSLQEPKKVEQKKASSPAKKFGKKRKIETESTKREREKIMEEEKAKKEENRLKKKAEKKETKKKFEEETRRRKAEEKAKRKEEKADAKKKVEEEAKRKEEEEKTKRKAEEEARKMEEDEKKREIDEETKIKELRILKDEQKRQERASAIRIQSMIRGHNARKAYIALREQRSMYEEVEIHVSEPVVIVAGKNGTVIPAARSQRSMTGQKKKKTNKAQPSRRGKPRLGSHHRSYLAPTSSKRPSFGIVSEGIMRTLTSESKSSATTVEPATEVAEVEEIAPDENLITAPIVHVTVSKKENNDLDMYQDTFHESEDDNQLTQSIARMPLKMGRGKLPLRSVGLRMGLKKSSSSDALGSIIPAVRPTVPPLKLNTTTDRRSTMTDKGNAPIRLPGNNLPKVSRSQSFSGESAVLMCTPRSEYETPRTSRSPDSHAVEPLEQRQFGLSPRKRRLKKRRVKRKPTSNGVPLPLLPPQLMKHPVISTPFKQSLAASQFAAEQEKAVANTLIGNGSRKSKMPRVLYF